MVINAGYRNSFSRLALIPPPENWNSFHTNGFVPGREFITRWYDRFFRIPDSLIAGLVVQLSKTSQAAIKNKIPSEILLMTCELRMEFEYPVVSICFICSTTECSWLISKRYLLLFEMGSVVERYPRVCKLTVRRY